MENNSEIWKPVVGYEGLYEVSNMGRVRSLERINKRGFNLSSKILKPTLNSGGYCIVGLFKNGLQRKILVHRLVAECFLYNVENKPFIDHINTIRTDNRVENIRWVTTKENQNNPLTIKYRKGHTEWCVKGEKHHRNKPIIQYDKEGNFIKEWFSIRESSEQNNVKEQNISACCRGKIKYAGGFIWKYKE